MLNQLNLPTLGLILLMGGGNWFATQKTGDESRSEILQAIRQVHDLHESLDDWEKRQKEGLVKMNAALDNQNQLLRNQGTLLAHDQQILDQFNKHGP